MQCVCIMLALLQYFGCFLYFNLSNQWTEMEMAADGVTEVTVPTESGHRIEWLLRNLTANLCAIGLALIPTAYPVWLSVRKERRRRAPAKSEAEMEMDVSNQIALNQISQDVSEMSEAENVYGETESMLAMKHIIKGYDSFKAFMQHLVSEFSTESLLFLVEYAQVKHSYEVKNSLKKGALPVSPEPRPTFGSAGAHVADQSVQSPSTQSDDSDVEEKEVSTFLYGVDGQVLTKIAIPLDIPKSVILRNQKSLQGQMDALYHKYVKVNSDHELNLSAVNRKALRKRFEKRSATPGRPPSTSGKRKVSDNLQVKEEKSEEEVLLNCMDSAAMQILALLQDPFTRFKNTPLWQPEFLKA